MSTSSTPPAPSLPYHEPSTATILLLTTFLLLLNVTDYLLNLTIYCGLIGQILLGIAWGTPSNSHFLSESTEQTIVDIGYLGLILIVYEGGLSTSFQSLISNMKLSVGVAVTGISLPIALSYVLVALVGATPLQAFAAGAALCSTSLGTTFTVLGTSGLVRTRMGVVLSTAAMLDDVVGLVMVQVISNLGGGGEFTAVVVVRPVLVSIGFLVVVPVVAWLVVRPGTGWINAWRKGSVERYRSGSGSVGIQGKKDGMIVGVERVMKSEAFALTVHTLLLVGMVAASSYAGTSNLFAAYLAGAAISWWDSEVPHLDTDIDLQQETRAGLNDTTTPGGNHSTIAQKKTTISGGSKGLEGQTSAEQNDTKIESHLASTTGMQIFEKYYQPALSRILRPFFFASIGFSIPITQMFDGTIVWKGIVYSILMFIAKLACGMWLVRIPGLSLSISNKMPKLGWLLPGRNRKDAGAKDSNSRQKISKCEVEDQDEPDIKLDNLGSKSNVDASQQLTADGKEQAQTNNHDKNPNVDANSQNRDEITAPKNRSNVSRKMKQPPQSPNTGLHNTKPKQEELQQEQLQSSRAPKPISLYPSLIVGCAMAARGEIGFLISSLAQSNGIFDTAFTGSGSEQNGSESSPIFLIVTWAIMLCTFVGPIVVGIFVRRVRKLETVAHGSVSGNIGRKERDVLGVWGVN